MTIVFIRNVDTGLVHSLFVSPAETLAKLRILWHIESGLDPEWFYFTDIHGQAVPEDGFISRLMKQDSKSFEIRVEELCPVKVNIEGFNQFSVSVPVPLSITAAALEKYIFETLVLPEREMVLRSDGQVLSRDATLSTQSISRGSEITADFEYIIHIEEIGDVTFSRTVECYASQRTFILFNQAYPVIQQRLHLDDMIIPNSSKISEILKDYGGLYLREWFMQLERRICIKVTFPRWRGKIHKNTLIKQVWPLDELKTLINQIFPSDSGQDAQVLWQQKILPTECTFLQAGIDDGSRLVVGIILTLLVKELTNDHILIPNTDTVSELKEKIKQVVNISFSHLRHRNTLLVPEDRILKNCGIWNGCEIELVEGVIPYEMVYQGRDFDIGELDVNIEFNELLNIANQLDLNQFDKNTIFECASCKQVISFESNRSHYNTCATLPRRLTAFKTMKITIVGTGGYTVHLQKPTTKKIWEIINEIIDEDEIGLQLLWDNKVLENNKRLDDYFKNGEPVELRMKWLVNSQKTQRNFPFPRITTLVDEEFRSTLSVGTSSSRQTDLTSIARNCTEISGASERLDIERPVSGSLSQAHSHAESHMEFHLKCPPTQHSLDYKETDLSSILGGIHTQITEESISAVFEHVSSEETQHTAIWKLERLEHNNTTLSSSDSSSDAKTGDTFLLPAVREGDIDLIKLLLEKVFDVNAVGTAGMTALHLSAFKNAVEIMVLLIDHGADTEVRQLNSATPLHIACQENHLEAVKLLLDRGANVQATMKGGATPLLLASSAGHIDVVETLLQCGADTEISLEIGVTPLYKAVQNNNINVIRLLLIYGANPNVVLKSGATPLFRAVHNNFVEVAHLLIEFGADVNYRKMNDITALHLAAQVNDCEMVNLLISWGADLDSTLITGGTPLHIAVQSNNLSIVEALTHCGANVNVSWLDGATPLHVAIYNRRYEIARTLIRKGADCNATMDDGTTPLLIAVNENDINLASLLIDNGADVNKPRSDGVTAFQIAYSFNRVNIINLLRDNGAKMRTATSCYQQ